MQVMKRTKKDNYMPVIWWPPLQKDCGFCRLLQSRVGDGMYIYLEKLYMSYIGILSKFSLTFLHSPLVFVSSCRLRPLVLMEPNDKSERHR